MSLSNTTTSIASQTGTSKPNASKKRDLPMTRPLRTPKKIIVKPATLQKRRHAYDTNFHGTHVIGNMNFITKMAGYIGLSTTREVHELYHTPYFQALLNDSVGKKGEG
ncbi:hypothetical protein ACHAPG_011491 [Botrytis cinerea]